MVLKSKNILFQHEDETMEESVSRRKFLIGAGALAAGAAFIHGDDHTLASLSTLVWACKMAA